MWIDTCQLLLYDRFLKKKPRLAPGRELLASERRNDTSNQKPDAIAPPAKKRGSLAGGGMSWHRFVSNYNQKQKDADVWQAFHSKFMELAREEQGREAIITKGGPLRGMDHVLRASCSYRQHPEKSERGNPEQGLVTLLDTPPHGVWKIGDGVSENFRERVRLQVVKAGQALRDYPGDTDPEDFWLHRLYLDLLENNSDLLFAVSKEGGMIVSVCVASATFCSRLERQALGIMGPDIATAQAESPSAESSEKSAALTNADVLAQNSQKTAQIPESREGILKPILSAQGLSIHDWATKADVDFHTANNYFRGKSVPYPATLKKLADALGIEVAKLPK